MKKPLVAVPRLAELGEVIDDHQVDFACAMERRGLVKTVCDVELLGEVIADIEPGQALLDSAPKEMLIETLQAFLRSIDEA